MLSDEDRRRIESEAGRYPSRRAALSEALLIAQESRGWLSDEGLADAAREVGISEAAAESVATSTSSSTAGRSARTSCWSAIR